MIIFSLLRDCSFGIEICSVVKQMYPCNITQCTALHLFADADDSQNITFVTNAVTQMLLGNERERNLNQVEQTQEKSSLCNKALQQRAVLDDLITKDAPVLVSQDERHMFKESTSQKSRESTKQLVVVHPRSDRRDKFHVTGTHRFSTISCKRQLNIMLAQSSASHVIKSGFVLLNPFAAKVLKTYQEGCIRLNKP